MTNLRRVRLLRMTHLCCELLIQDTSVLSLKFATSLLQFGSVANSSKMQVLRLRCAPLRMTNLRRVRLLRMTHLCCELLILDTRCEVQVGERRMGEMGRESYRTFS